MEEAPRETVVIPEAPEAERKAAWQKPELEKFPLNEARTGHLSGLSDSELYS